MQYRTDRPYGKIQYFRIQRAFDEYREGRSMYIMKRMIPIVLSVIIAGAAAGCGNSGSGKGDESAAKADSAETKDTAGESNEEQNTGIANPWVYITQEEAGEIIPKLFVPPAGAENILWKKCEPLADADKGISPLVELDFTLDGLDYTARAQTGAENNADIAGIYLEWTVGPEDTTLAGWGGSDLSGKTYRAISDDEYTDLITWYDDGNGILYSLSTSSSDLDGFDIQATAEAMAP